MCEYFYFMNCPLPSAHWPDASGMPINCIFGAFGAELNKFEARRLADAKLAFLVPKMVAEGLQTQFWWSTLLFWSWWPFWRKRRVNEFRLGDEDQQPLVGGRAAEKEVAGDWLGNVGKGVEILINLASRTFHKEFGEWTIFFGFGVKWKSKFLSIQWEMKNWNGFNFGGNIL